jgi:hypothetical protein
MLESETIKASALRYKLHRMPSQVKDEIQGEQQNNAETFTDKCVYSENLLDLLNDTFRFSSS